MRIFFTVFEQRGIRRRAENSYRLQRRDETQSSSLLSLSIFSFDSFKTKAVSTGYRENQIQVFLVSKKFLITIQTTCFV